MVRQERKLLTPEKFRKLGGFVILQDKVLPILMALEASFASDEDRKGLAECLLKVEKERLKKLMEDIGYLEESKGNKAWAVLKPIFFAGRLLSFLLPSWIAINLVETAYFRWLCWNEARRDKALRQAAKEDGIWFGLLVNDRYLIQCRELWKTLD